MKIPEKVVQCSSCEQMVDIELARCSGLSNPPDFQFKWQCNSCWEKEKKELISIIEKENGPALISVAKEEPLRMDGSDQLRKEIHDVIRRYGQESDVTVYSAIGTLEIVKMDLVEMLERARE